MDRRDEKTWVILELSHLGESKVSEGVFATQLKKLLGKKYRDEVYELFVPTRIYEKGGRKVALQLMEGYAFIDSNHDFDFFLALENTDLIRSVMRTPSPSGVDTLHSLPNREVDALRNQLREMIMKDVDEGSIATVTKGIYKNLDGLVLGLIEEDALVKIDLRTISVITLIPQMFLETTDTEQTT